VSAFAYRDGVLCVEDVPIPRMAEAVGTPFYVYSSAALTDNYRRFADAFAGMNATVCYAMKANSNLAVLRLFADLGAGADVVSEGELRRALAAGIRPERIVFSGVGKTQAEMAFAIEAGIHQINVESLPEMEALSAVAAAKGVRMPIAIRVNPDVDAGTHHKISTGRAEDKFGIDIADAPAAYARAATLPGIDPVAVAVHIGSQLTDLAPFRAAFGRVAELVATLRGQGIDIRRLDLGGGLGIVYREEAPPAPADYAAVVRETVGALDCAVMLEPGRALVGNAGLLVTRVIYIKEGRTRRFAIVDAAMNDLIRPALYEAWHAMRPVREPAPGTPAVPHDVVGPICETGDTFAVARPLPPLLAEELLVMEGAGAYGSAMSSTYNSRPLVPEVLVQGAAFAVVRARPDHAEMLRLERLADWQDTDTPERRVAGAARTT